MVGIKKPSIVHHYSSKALLGEAVVRRYREQFSAALDTCIQHEEQSLQDAFDFYCAPYLDVGNDGQKVCLCGSLAGEFFALPRNIQDEVKLFFESQMDWLENVLMLGLSRGEFEFDEAPRKLAELILNSLQGALIVQRAIGSSVHIDNTVSELKRLIFKV